MEEMSWCKTVVQLTLSCLIWHLRGYAMKETTFRGILKILNDFLIKRLSSIAHVGKTDIIKLIIGVGTVPKLTFPAGLRMDNQHVLLLTSCDCILTLQHIQQKFSHCGQKQYFIAKNTYLIKDILLALHEHQLFVQKI